MHAKSKQHISFKLAESWKTRMSKTLYCVWHPCYQHLIVKKLKTTATHYTKAVAEVVLALVNQEMGCGSNHEQEAPTTDVLTSIHVCGGKILSDYSKS